MRQTHERSSPPLNGRLFHEIEAGESLASLAMKRLGDTRFARLIFTINRGEIPVRCDGFNTYAYIYPGQKILLPTAEEASVYKKNFLTESARNKFDLAHYARPAMPSDSIPVSFKNLKDETKIAEKYNSFQVIDWGTPHSDVGNSAATAALNWQDSNDSASQTQELEPEETEEEKERDGAFDMAPPAQESPRIMKPWPQAGQSYTRLLALKTDEQDLLYGQGNLEITTLSHYCRVMKFESLSEESEVLIKLQVFDNRRWQTISSYTIKKDQTMRISHYADGTADRVSMEIPTSIAREISLGDFTKNWKNYTKVYFNHKENSRLQQAFGNSTGDFRQAV
jgi:hypothetical protein